MTLEEGLELIKNYKKGLQKFLDTLPEQSVQIGSEMIKTLTMSTKNEIANLESIEKALKHSPKHKSDLSDNYN
ncbi:MAG TPA: hypothetical protein VLD64_06225 [Nitrosarchaeum sp.]|jgi:hypothetical protein|nr:hypothetical protein [Nitrosarchaeum sp.]